MKNRCSLVFHPGKSYALEDWHGTYKSPIWKGKWSSKPPWLCSMLIFRGVSVKLLGVSLAFGFIYHKRHFRLLQAVFVRRSGAPDFCMSYLATNEWPKSTTTREMRNCFENDRSINEMACPVHMDKLLFSKGLFSTFHSDSFKLLVKICQRWWSIPSSSLETPCPP